MREIELADTYTASIKAFFGTVTLFTAQHARVIDLAEQAFPDLDTPAGSAAQLRIDWPENRLRYWVEITLEVGGQVSLNWVLFEPIVS